MSDQFIRLFPDHAARALTLAAQAAQARTFGVGAVLVDNRGKVLAENRNRTWGDRSFSNATAHAEMLVMRQYFSRRQAGEKLPPPSACTIISTLDPCMMCAGAVMHAGFKQLSLTIDKRAGINCHGPGNFTTLPLNMRARAQHTFALAGIIGRRKFSGVATGLPAVELPACYEDDARGLFRLGCQNIKKEFHEARDLCELAPRTYPKQRMPKWISALLQDTDGTSLHTTTDPQNPGIEIAGSLLEKAHKARKMGHTENACGLLDPNGTLLLTVGSCDAQSPLNTAVMNLTLTYEHIRRRAGFRALPWLPSRHKCTMVQLHGANATPPSLMDIAIVRSRLWHVIPRASLAVVHDMIERMPNLYHAASPDDAPRQVMDQALIRACGAHHYRPG